MLLMFLLWQFESDCQIQLWVLNKMFLRFWASLFVTTSQGALSWKSMQKKM